MSTKLFIDGKGNILHKKMQLLKEASKGNAEDGIFCSHDRDRGTCLLLNMVIIHWSLKSGERASVVRFVTSNNLPSQENNQY